MTQINFTAQTLFNIGSLPITNAFFTALVITAVCAVFVLLASRKFGLVPTRFQLMVELLWENMLATAVGSFGSKEKAKKFFPLFMTLFIFILIANQFTIIPLVSSFVVGETSLFRLPTSDLTLTIALALMIFLLSNYLAIRRSPLKHLSKFIKLGPFLKVRSVGQFVKAVIGFLLGLMDAIGEVAKIISLSFRLFGNVFAGGAVVAVIGGLSVYTSMLVPIPFIILSIFSGLIQALVFALLSIEFVAMAVREE